MVVTKAQAAAFIEALCGYYGPDEETAGVPNSIGAVHHLQAVLGLQKLPWAGRMRGKSATKDGHTELTPFRDYLAAVVRTITIHLESTKQEPADAN